ncbi:acyl carrier protein [Nonomuraea sp. NPDC049400]|uniref:acyl carrier protein n=1 Tax=Nonomuraea sp. NPDC049400 TaxID=3364352 RepID=UPI00378DD3D8
MASTPFDEANFRTWLTERLARHLKREPSAIDADTPLADYGLDSLYALAIVDEIENYLGIAIDATIMWDYPSVSALSSALATKLAIS